MSAQMNHGIIPASLTRPDSMMAKFLPITAMFHLSKYRKGPGSLPPPIFLAIHALNIDVFDHCAGDHFHSELGQVLGRP
jgi:hypothetical protein